MASAQDRGWHAQHHGSLRRGSAVFSNYTACIKVSLVARAGGAEPGCADLRTCISDIDAEPEQALRPVAHLDAHMPMLQPDAPGIRHQGFLLLSPGIVIPSRLQ